MKLNSALQSHNLRDSTEDMIHWLNSNQPVTASSQVQLPTNHFYVHVLSCYLFTYLHTSVMCPRGLGLVLEAPQGQKTVALALASITKSLALALVPSPWS